MSQETKEELQLKINQNAHNMSLSNIRFRGIPLQDNKFRFGYVVRPQGSDNLMIVEDSEGAYCWEVCQDTIGQIIPFTDRDNNDVYISDIVKFENSPVSDNAYQVGYYNDKTIGFFPMINPETTASFGLGDAILGELLPTMKVVGNIFSVEMSFDNPVINYTNIPQDEIIDEVENNTSSEVNES